MKEKLVSFGNWLSLKEAEDLVDKIEAIATPKAEQKKMQSLYKFSDPNTIFEDLRFYIKEVIAGKQNGLLITGSAGVGKTFIVNQEMKKAGLKPDVDYYNTGSGSSTAVGMYITLFEQNGKIVIFDDCDQVLDDKDGCNLLKGALDSNEERRMSWQSAINRKTASGEMIPKSFLFTGKVIFISNKAQRALDPALQTRSYVLEVALSPKDMLAYINKMLPLIYPKISIPLKKAALRVIEMIAKTDPNVVLNMRTMKKAADILDDSNDLTAALRRVQQQISYDTK